MLSGIADRSDCGGEDDAGGEESASNPSGLGWRRLSFARLPDPTGFLHRTSRARNAAIFAVNSAISSSCCLVAALPSVAACVSRICT